MKVKIALPLMALVLLALACNLVGAEPAPTQEPLPTEAQAEPTAESPPLESEKRCGDGVCDGPENVNNCPQDCKDVSDTV
jgi:hypothetical protein